MKTSQFKINVGYPKRQRILFWFLIATISIPLFSHSARSGFNGPDMLIIFYVILLPVTFLSAIQKTVVFDSENRKVLLKKNIFKFICFSPQVIDFDQICDVRLLQYDHIRSLYSKKLELVLNDGRSVPIDFFDFAKSEHSSPEKTLAMIKKLIRSAN